jgi:signal peptidase complex subunit 1
MAFVVGYVQQDIYLTLWIGLAGCVMTVLVVVPPWPVFNQHPESWLRSGKGGSLRPDIVVGGKKIQ